MDYAIVFMLGALAGMQFTFWRVNKQLDDIGIPRPDTKEEV